MEAVEAVLTAKYVQEKKDTFKKNTDSAKSMALNLFVLIPAIALGVAYKLGNDNFTYGFKEYLDEIADVCSILLFAYVVATTFYSYKVIHLIKEEVDEVFEQIRKIQKEMERARMAAMNRMNEMDPPEECKQQ